MKSSKGTKRALLMSVLSMLLCLAMLIGSTFAWFTDSVTSGKNKIVAGNLDVELEYATAFDATTGAPTAWAPVTTTTKLFNDDALWEPGHTEVAYLKIRNAGTLSLNYKLTANVITETRFENVLGTKSLKLSSYLKFGHADSTTEIAKYTTRDAAQAAVAGTETTLMDYSNAEKLEAGQEKYVALVIYMPKDTGNVANYKTGTAAPTIELGVNLVATQTPHEEDSFGPDYDDTAVYPIVPDPVNVSVKGNITVADGGNVQSEKFKVEGTNRQFSINVPANAVEEDTNATFSVVLTDSTADSVTYDISLKNTTTEETIELSEEATVTIYTLKHLKNVKVEHDGSPMAEDKYVYTASSGKLTIQTSSFSPFKITYEPIVVASLNGVGYWNFTTALMAAKEGDTLVLCNDINLDYLDVRKNLTIDLNGHALSGTSNWVVYVNEKDGVELTLKNGTIQGKNGFYLDKSAKVTLDHVKLAVDTTSGYAIHAIENSKGIELTLNNCEVEGLYGIGFKGNNHKITVDGCKINGAQIGVYQNGSYSPNVYSLTNSQITGTVAVYISNASGKDDNGEDRELQELTMENCTASGLTAVEIKHTNATITNCTLIATSETKSATTEPPSGGSNTKGYALAVSTNKGEAEATGTVTVTNAKDQDGAAITAEEVFVFKNGNVTIDGTKITVFGTYTTAP